MSIRLELKILGQVINYLLSIQYVIFTDFAKLISSSIVPKVTLICSFLYINVLQNVVEFEISF